MRLPAKQLNVIVGQGHFNNDNVALPNGTSVVVTTHFSGKSPGGAGGITPVVGVYTDSTNDRNYVSLKASSTGKALKDSQLRLIYARLTEAATVWTLSFYVLIAGSETAYDFTGHDEQGNNFDFRWCEAIQIAGWDAEAVVHYGDLIDELNVTGHSHVIQLITITGDGQTALVLTQTPKFATAVKLFVNGAKQLIGGGKDYTVVGTAVTWLDRNFTLQTTDEVTAVYEV